MKLLLTGSTGYIGHNLALAAASKGYLVHALVRDCSLVNRPVHKNIRYFKGDINEPHSIEAAIGGCDVVIHTAALAQIWNKDRSLFYKINVDGTKNMLEAAKQQGVKKFLFTSTCAVFGPSGVQPLNEDHPRSTPFENDYEISKYCAEELVREYAGNGLFSLIVSLPRVYGPGLNTGSNAVNGMIKKVLKNGIAFVPSAGNVVANYAFIDDVVRGHFEALQHGFSRETYILSGEKISYHQLFKTIVETSGRNIKTIRLPKAVLKAWSAVVFSKCYLRGKHTNISPRTIDRLFKNRALSCAKAVEQIGYRITAFQYGMEQTIYHLKTHQNE
jgi:nucleoside-diphosphate-sugar epimerase